MALARETVFLLQGLQRQKEKEGRLDKPGELDEDFYLKLVEHST